MTRIAVLMAKWLEVSFGLSPYIFFLHIHLFLCRWRLLCVFFLQAVIKRFLSQFDKNLRRTMRTKAHQVRKDCKLPCRVCKLWNLLLDMQNDAELNGR